MIHKRPEKDTKNPPGQIVNRPVYLRDEIAKIQEHIRKEDMMDDLLKQQAELEKKYYPKGLDINTP